MFDYRKDLTEYNDEELSMIVMNDGYFYDERKDEAYLMALISEQFIYTSAQLETLKNDLKEG